MIEELDPELFLYELYDSSGPLMDPYDIAKSAIGYCDASRLQVRPRLGLLAIMCQLPEGKIWFHIDQRTLELIRKRKQRETARQNTK